MDPSSVNNNFTFAKYITSVLGTVGIDKEAYGYVRYVKNGLIYRRVFRFLQPSGSIIFEFKREMPEGYYQIPLQDPADNAFNYTFSSLFKRLIE